MTMPVAIFGSANWPASMGTSRLSMGMVQVFPSRSFPEMVSSSMVMLSS